MIGFSASSVNAFGAITSLTIVGDAQAMVSSDQSYSTPNSAYLQADGIVGGIIL